MSVSVLIVDADRLLVDVLAEHLESQGAVALGTTSGAIAGHHLATLRPDAVVLDAHLPEAAEILRQVREDVPGIKVIVLCRQAHRLGTGNFVVLDRNHGLQYLATTLDALLGSTIAAGAGTVLVANPQTIAREYLQRVIEEQGHAVYAVTDSQDALGFIARVPETRVVLLDMEMSEKGGLDCLTGDCQRQQPPGSHHHERLAGCGNCPARATVGRF